MIKDYVKIKEELMNLLENCNDFEEGSFSLTEVEHHFAIDMWAKIERWEKAKTISSTLTEGVELTEKQLKWVNSIIAKYEIYEGRFY